MLSQEYKNDEYPSSVERDEKTPRTEPTHDGYDKPVPNLGEENPPDSVGDRDTILSVDVGTDN